MRSYSEARDALIPLAERHANLKEGTQPAEVKLRPEWAGRWNRCFLGEMERLWRREAKG